MRLTRFLLLVALQRGLVAVARSEFVCQCVQVQLRGLSEASGGVLLVSVIGLETEVIRAEI